VAPLYVDEDDYKDQLKAQIKRLSELQDLLYAHNRYALLLIFQAMDAAGKDSIIKHVMSGVNPQGCQVFSFKHPSAQELDHDFLWRTSQCLPERGRIGIFNRSYYEEVLVVRVRPEILKGQSLPEGSTRAPKLWAERHDSINALERHLHRNGTRIIKFFLHLSKEEQRQRFLARLDDPAKNWKFSAADLDERALWPRYMNAYREALAATSSAHAPWYVVPADDKRNARLIVSQVIVDALQSLKMRYPPPTLGAQELAAVRKRLSRT
jgi:PPK2 family polyphosphate:nucleotide phosphotransferase